MDKSKAIPGSMVQRIFLSLLSGVVLICSGGCAGSFVPFTGAHFEQYEADLHQVQFYLSDRVVLNRQSEAETREVEAASHRLRLSREQRVEKIFINPHTPGVLQRIEGDTLFVQFEPPPGDRRRALPFRATALYPQEASAETVVYLLDALQLTYDGQSYAVDYVETPTPVTHGDGAVYAEKDRPAENVQYILRRRFPFLLINPVKETGRFQVEQRKLPGLRVEAP